jgi:hypothetical protein
MSKRSKSSTDLSESNQGMTPKSASKSLADNLWDDDDSDGMGYQDEWLETSAKESMSSRHRRQAAARRELERRMESKRLKKWTQDWYDDDFDD